MESAGILPPAPDEGQLAMRKLLSDTVEGCSWPLASTAVLRLTDSSCFCSALHMIMTNGVVVRKGAGAAPPSPQFGPQSGVHMQSGGPFVDMRLSAKP